SNLILLDGEMGTGKTTLVKTIMAMKGVHEVSSPTFAIVNRYDSDEGAFFHFDLYRIEEMEELYDIGFEEYLESGSPCLIEWPQILYPTLDQPFIKISIEMVDERRIFTISLPEVN
ncbi:MAG: tRNA (adenosine(37)-N6)-threonylcarbamoyltransferase complex ATPase subunit type 1 TsaE, partial [Flavobacteriales bacterium]|nr:tRNA (adenosine(37)-N6)-threonylcarbamoyltransferase complex ATPase subunit type 1 TsaE [Flavobacteriales bacterium]